MEIVDFKSLHEQVWQMRHEVEGKWAIPDPVDALRFAVTEAAEMLDVILRQNPIYTRNHRKALKLGQEAAQCSIMLLTALGEVFDWEQERIKRAWGYYQTGYEVAQGNGFAGTRVDWISCLVSDALQEELWREAKGEHEGGWLGEFLGVQALVEIGLEVDLVTEVGLELSRIRKKMNG
jgi:hypothetical protein